MQAIGVAAGGEALGQEAVAGLGWPSTTTTHFSPDLPL